MLHVTSTPRLAVSSTPAESPPEQSLASEYFQRFLRLEASYASERALANPSHQQAMDERYGRIVQMALGTLFPQGIARSSQVVGLQNAAGNCSINALLQMLFSSPHLLEPLLRVPQLQELRKAYLQHMGMLPGPINTQALRSELHLLNPLISPNANRWEDAHELLSTMLSYVSEEDPFPVVDHYRFYDPVAQDSIPFHGNPDQASRLQTRTRHDQPYCFTSRRGCDPVLFIDPRADHNGVATFANCLREAFDNDESESDPARFLHDGDLTHLHSHQPQRSIRIYRTTPSHLMVTLPRFAPNGEARDVPMQMPRVLALPRRYIGDHSEGRLLLQSFVVYQPGHYVSYVRRGDQWFYCSDTIVRPAPLTEVDRALCYTSGGGSYLHYYERVDLATLNREPPMTAYDPLPDVERERIPSSQIAILRALKTALSQSEISTKRCFKLFAKLDPELRYYCYCLLCKDWIVERGVQRFLQNPASLLPFIDELGSLGEPLKAVLQQEPIDLQAAFQAFRSLSPAQQMRCYEFLCKKSILHHGLQAFLRNPAALLREVAANDQTIPIIDHLLKEIEEPEEASPEAQSMEGETPSVTTSTQDGASGFDILETGPIGSSAVFRSLAPQILSFLGPDSSNAPEGFIALSQALHQTNSGSTEETTSSTRRAQRKKQRARLALTAFHIQLKNHNEITITDILREQRLARALSLPEERLPILPEVTSLRLNKTITPTQLEMLLSRLPNLQNIFIRLHPHESVGLYEVIGRHMLRRLKENLASLLEYCTEHSYPDLGSQARHCLMLIDNPTNRETFIAIRQNLLRDCENISNDPELTRLAQNCRGLRNLDSGGIYSDELNALLLSYPDLESISIWHGSINSNTLQVLANTCPGLQRIELYQSGSINEDSMLFLIDKCRKLRRIHLYDCSGLTDEIIRALVENFPDLEDLCLGDCSQLTDDGIAALVEGCPALQRLQMNHASRLTDGTLETLAQCQNLSDVVFLNSPLFTDTGLLALARGRKGGLRYIELKGNDQITIAGVTGLSQQCSSLESFGFDSRKFSVYDIVPLIGHCPRLRAIDSDKHHYPVEHLRERARKAQQRNPSSS